ncbi:MAG: TetR/AcrR family transcriptional regulator [Pseudomonadota bacterium]
MARAEPLLHRDDPDREPLIGNIKVTREDWLAVAMEVLIVDGVEQVKILSLSERLGVSRSSFYWYFKSRQDLLDQLLASWEAKNTGGIVTQCAKPSATITQAVCNLFRCFVHDGLFDPKLDFAVREWARRSGTVRAVVDRSDDQRIDAIQAMFVRHSYSEEEATVRARILYYMQIGYYAREVREPLEDRLALVPTYLFSFTGQEADPAEVAALAAFARDHEERTP